MGIYEPWPTFGVVRAIKVVKKDDVFGEFLLANGEIYAATGLMLEKYHAGCYLMDDGKGDVLVVSVNFLKELVKQALQELN